MGRITCGLAVLLLAAGGARAADAKPEVDKKIGGIIFDALTEGVALFNNGNAEGCYRIYQGTLMAVAPMLDHRPKAMEAAKAALATAKGQPPATAAFTLRKAMDDIRAEVEGTTTKKALWDRLGGEPAVKAVVHDFVVLAAGDPKVNFFRDGKYKVDAAGVVKLERLLVEMISSATGGPLKYNGRDMKTSHAGMKITEAEFNALAADLISVLNKYKVPQAEQDELVKIVTSTKGDIVEVGGGADMAKKALWDRLGGEPAVKAVVHDFVVLAAGDPKVNFFRDGKYKLDAAGVVKLERQLVEMISSATGGPLKYTGRSMAESHAGMKITEAEFNALAGHLIDTLKKYKVPQAEVDELVKIVAGTKGDIVGK